MTCKKYTFYKDRIYCLFIVVKCIFLHIETCKNTWYTFYK